MLEKARLLFEEHVAQPELVKIMVEAFELALELLPDGADQEAAARAILAAAKSGERDPVRLCNDALYAVRHHR